MKIIIVHYKYHIQGGPERYMFNFINLASKNGCNVIPFSVEYSKNYKSDYSSYFVSPWKKSNGGVLDDSSIGLLGAIKGAWNEFHNFKAARNMKKIIQDENPDLIYVLIPGLISTDIYKVANDLHVPIILRLSDFRLLCGNYSLLYKEEICEDCIYGSYWCMVKKRCVHDSTALSLLRSISLSYTRKRKLYNYVDAVISPPDFTRKKFIKSGFFPSNKMYVNQTFIDTTDITPNYNNKGYVLCLGRFSIEKGFGYVVESMSYLKDLDVKVAVTGKWENCSNELKSFIKLNDLRDKIKFVGFLHGSDLKELVSNAMCVACPAIWYENMPNVILEAYAYGKPVIASDIGSLAEVVEDGKTGLLFEPKNSEQIAECIRMLYEDSSLTEKLGKNARIEAESKYSPEAHWKRFVDICTTVGIDDSF